MLTYLEALATPLVTIKSRAGINYYYHGTCVTKPMFGGHTQSVRAWEFDPLARHLNRYNAEVTCDRCHYSLQGPPRC